MPKEYRYPLTRLCIRTGALTLPARLIALFPAEGTVLLRDVEHDVEVLADIPEPRIVTGLAEYFADFEVEVNDDVFLTPQDDGTFVMRLHKRPRRAAIEVEEADEGPEVVVVQSESAIAVPAVPAEPDAPAAAAEPEQSVPEPAVPSPPAQRAVPETPEVSTPAWGLFTDVEDDVVGDGEAVEAGTLFPDELPETTAPVAAEPVKTPADIALETPLTDLQDRLSEHLAPFGFHTEIVAEDLVAGYAQLGTKSYTVLFRLLPAGERLDWGVLLTLRRGGTYDYVAIVGDHHDLIAVSNPAAVAKTTLVTWDALARARQLHRGVPISALDFEPYFATIGLFEDGLQHFENHVAAKLTARGNLSELLTMLADRDAPTVLTFTELDAELDDLAEGELAQLVNLLTGAPFHLFERVSDREVLLTRSVSEMLGAVALYAESLGAQLGDEPEL